ncbi:MAG: hypothetical protein LBK52_02750 [Deltaproteobacteria bacterium]|jgi:nucleoside phosphorylase|nr:hypothetical protein [Deltaproteobacteria bacterium]
MKVLILTATQAEYQALDRVLAPKTFARLSCRLALTGPGKINAALACAGLLEKINPDFLLVCGTAGTLDLSLRAGDTVVSREVIIGDWYHWDGAEYQTGPYGAFDYGPPTAERVESMVLRPPAGWLDQYWQLLGQRDFRPGRIFSSDIFAAGRDLKLSLGRTYGCLICEMEGGAIAWTARVLKKDLPWLHLRAAADTLDDSLADYFELEAGVTEILAQRVIEALEILDSLRPVPPGP